MLTSRKLALIATVLALPLALPAQSRHWVDPNASDRQRSIVDSVNFETDTAVVVNGHATLACVAEATKQDPTLFVEVDGYADGRGGDAYNQRLSKARAESVVEYLLALGAPRDRVVALGRGKAGSAADTITNFARRKAVIVLRRGSFGGDLVKEIPTASLPCASVANGELPMGRIESNGQTFLVSVDYAKIRNDFRAEVGRMMAEQKESQFEQGGDGALPNGPGSNSAATQGQNSKSRPAPGNASQASTADVDGGSHDFRLTISGFHTDLKGIEQSVGVFEAAGLFRTAGGGLQTGIQGEFGAYRHKLQGDLAYSALAGRFQGTLFASYATMSGAALPDATLYPNQQAFMGGVRLAYEGEVVGVGVFAAQGASSQGTGLQPSQAPRGAAGLDFRLSGDRWSLGLTGFESMSAQRGTTPATLASSTGGLLDLGCRIGDRFQILARAESLPIYDTFSAKRETRFGLGIRIGGIGARRLPNWIQIPSARLIFPY